MSWWCQILTGADNQTIAIGRAIGVAVAIIFLVLLPAIVWATLAKHLIGADEWGTIFDKLTVYVPAVCLAVAGLVGLTAHAEPKGDQP